MPPRLLRCRLVEDINIRHAILNLLAQAVANSIAAFALVVVPFAFMGRWPPPELFIGSSIGGALSPFVWRMYRAMFGYPVRPSDEGGAERPEVLGGPQDAWDEGEESVVESRDPTDNGA